MLALKIASDCQWSEHRAAKTPTPFAALTSLAKYTTPTASSLPPGASHAQHEEAGQSVPAFSTSEKLTVPPLMRSANTHEDI